MRYFREVLERKWAPGAVGAEHSHPFDADALVVQGEMWLTVDDVVRHLRSGDTFALNANVVHEKPAPAARHPDPTRRVVLAWRRSFTRYEAIAALRDTLDACELKGVARLSRGAPWG